MPWRYYVKKGNETIKSEGGFASEDEAQMEAREYLRTSVSYTDQAFYTVTAGQDFIKTDPASYH
jgi:hypothetical protein